MSLLLRVRPYGHDRRPEHDPVLRVGRIQPQHLDETVGGVVDVAGFAVDHDQIATRPVHAAPEFEGAGRCRWPCRSCTRWAAFRLSPPDGTLPFPQDLDEDLVAFDLYRDGIGRKVNWWRGWVSRSAVLPSLPSSPFKTPFAEELESVYRSTSLKRKSGVP
jgi:hypothetical protein